jgi:hypothetical protein
MKHLLETVQDDEQTLKPDVRKELLSRSAGNRVFPSPGRRPFGAGASQ